MRTMPTAIPTQASNSGTQAAKEAVGEAGWDPQFGARPLKRALQRLLIDPLALRVLKGEFKPGQLIRVEAVADVLTFKSEDAEPSALLH